MDRVTAAPPGGWARSVPALTTVRHVVEHEYAIPVTRVVLIRSFNNDVYRVDTVEHAYALKVYGVGRWTADEVRWEQQLVRHLTGSGSPVAAAVRLRDGDTVGVLDAPEGERPFAMGRWVPGDKPRPPWTEELYRDVGTLLAGFHAAADEFRCTYPRRSVRTGDEIREVVAVLEHEPARRSLVRRAGAEAERQIARLAGRGLRWGLRHGDVSLDNIHVSDAGLILYDFDLSGPGWQVEDLAGALSTPFADVFLAGYTALRPLPSVELEALPWLRIVAAIENLRFHLIGKPQAQGTSTLAEGWVDSGFDLLAAIADEVGLAG